MQAPCGPAGRAGDERERLRMAANDDFARAREVTWHQFTRLMGVVVVLAVLILAGMAIFLL
jgi:hypothetical protein